MFPLIQQQIAVLKPPKGVEEDIIRLLLFLDLLRFIEENLSFRQTACLVQRIGQCRSLAHSLKCITASLSEVHALFSKLDSLACVADRQIKFAEVPGICGRVVPDLFRNTLLQSSLHRLNRLRQSAQRSKVESHLTKNKAFRILRKASHWPAPGGVEETGQCR